MTIPEITADPKSPPDADKDLTEQVSSFKGCVSILTFYGASLEVCYDVVTDGVVVKAVLKTPVGDVTVASGKLTIENSSIKVEQGIDGFKGGVELTYDAALRSIKLCGSIKYKIPLDGTQTKRGCTTINL